MLVYLVRRIVVMLASLVAVLGLAFALLQAAPGSPFSGEADRLETSRERLAQEHFVNKAFHVRLMDYVSGIIAGDWGESLQYPQRSVWSIISHHLPYTLLLIVSSLLCAYCLGIWLGVFFASLKHRFFGQLMVMWTVLAVCIPFFLLAPLLQALFGVQLDLLPVAGWSSTRGSERAWVLPLITVALPLIAWLARMSFSLARSYLASPWLRTGQAQGQSSLMVLRSQGIRPLLATLLAWLSPAMGMALTACVVVEPLYGVPGLARYLIDACLHRDYPLLMGIVLVFASLSLGISLLADLLSTALDPRLSPGFRKALR